MVRLCLLLALCFSFISCPTNAGQILKGESYDISKSMIVCLEEGAAAIFFKDVSKLPPGCIIATLQDFVPSHRVSNGLLNLPPYDVSFVVGTARVVSGTSQFKGLVFHDRTIYVALSSIVVNRSGQVIELKHPSFE